MKCVNPFIIYTLFLDFKVYVHMCKDETTGLCLQDFQFRDGLCEPCFGSWGINCTQNCTSGHYGFGCRKQCLCHSNQLCDKRLGCIEKVTDESTPGILCDVLLAISICAGCLCIILIVHIACKRYTARQNPDRTTIGYKATTGTIFIEQQEVTFDGEHPVFDQHDCLSQENGKSANDQDLSSCGTSLHTNLQCPNKRVMAEPSIPSLQGSSNNEQPLARNLSVYSNFYYKCELIPDEYDVADKDAMK